MTQVLTRNTDDLAIYAQDALMLTAEGLFGDRWSDPNFTTTNATLHDGVTLPSNWQSGVWSYTGGVWAVVNPGAHDSTLAVLRERLYTQIRAERDRRKFNGVFVSDKWIHSDTYSRTQWMAMVMMGASVPAIQWTTMDNTTTTTSQALASAVFQATASLDATPFAYAKSLMVTVAASNDPTSIDITTGWPATFEGAV